MYDKLRIELQCSIYHVGSLAAYPSKKQRFMRVQPIRTAADDGLNFFIIFFSEKIRLSISYESSDAKLLFL